MSTAPLEPPAISPGELNPRRSAADFRRVLDFLTTGGATAGAAVIALMLLLLFAVLLIASWPAISKFGLGFFYTSGWDPPNENFGAWPVIQGTLLSSLVALVVAVPISVGSAVFLVRVIPAIRGIRWQITRVFVSLVVTGLLTALFAALINHWLSPSAVADGETGAAGGLNPIAAILGLLLGLGAGVSTFLFMRNTHLVAGVSFLIELLAAIPSITYGLWGLLVMVPFVHDYIDPIFAATLAKQHWIHWGDVIENRITHKSHPYYFPGSFFTPTSTSYNLCCAGLILAIMIVPIITSITRDVLRSVPKDLDQGAYGVGATWWQATRIVLAYSKLGILGAVILGLGRALGETMAVTALIGAVVDKPVTNLFQSGSTISSLLANEFPSPSSDMHRQSMVYAALVLLLITMLINGAARVMVISIGRRAKK